MASAGDLLLSSPSRSLAQHNNSRSQRAALTDLNPAAELHGNIYVGTSSSFYNVQKEFNIISTALAISENVKTCKNIDHCSLEVQNLFEVFSHMDGSLA
jgi:hypothetical protein